MDSNTIINTVASEYGVTAIQITGTSRLAVIAEARYATMYLLSRYLGYTHEHIADMLTRNRATVDYGLKRFADFMSVDKDTKRHIANIKAALGVDAP